jgi:hypothetical protein
MRSRDESQESRAPARPWPEPASGIRPPTARKDAGGTRVASRRDYGLLVRRSASWRAAVLGGTRGARHLSGTGPGAARSGPWPSGSRSTVLITCGSWTNFPATGRRRRKRPGTVRWRRCVRRCAARSGRRSATPCWSPWARRRRRVADELRPAAIPPALAAWQSAVIGSRQRDEHRRDWAAWARVSGSRCGYRCPAWP